MLQTIAIKVGPVLLIYMQSAVGSRVGCGNGVCVISHVSSAVGSDVGFFVGSDVGI